MAEEAEKELELEWDIRIPVKYFMVIWALASAAGGFFASYLFVSICYWDLTVWTTSDTYTAGGARFLVACVTVIGAIVGPMIRYAMYHDERNAHLRHRR